MTDTIVSMLEALAQTQDELTRIRKSTGIEELEERVAEMKKVIGAAVLEYGQPVKASTLQAVINKGRTSWDGAKLDGMSAIIPQINEARKTGEPTVTIRAVK